MKPSVFVRRRLLQGEQASLRAPLQSISTKLGSGYIPPVGSSSCAGLLKFAETVIISHRTHSISKLEVLIYAGHGLVNQGRSGRNVMIPGQICCCIARQTPSEQRETPAYSCSRFHDLASHIKGILGVKIPLTSEYTYTHHYTYQHKCDLQKAVQPATT